jgi:hypothetical protein
MGVTIHYRGHLGLKGISFKPHPDCKSVPFFFESSGKLCGIMEAVLISEGLSILKIAGFMSRPSLQDLKSIYGSLGC